MSFYSLFENIVEQQNRGIKDLEKIANENVFLRQKKLTFKNEKSGDRTGSEMKILLSGIIYWSRP